MVKKRLLLTQTCCLMLAVCFAGCQPKNDLSLKEALKDRFLIGVAMNSAQITGRDSAGDALIQKHFNSIVAENCMKAEVIQPVEGEFDFSLADQFVRFGIQHQMAIIGHTLIWHSQAPKWFFTDEKGQLVSKELMIERMHRHISTVVTRYKGKVKGWDVVNEAINDDGTWRESPFYKIIGPEYVALAFKFAHEADPNAELYYNDYNMAKEGRRLGVIKLVQELKKAGLRVDAVGMQGHFTMDYPAINEYEKSIDAFAATGVKIMITELDMTVLPMPEKKITADVAYKYQYDPKINPYYKGLPDSVSKAFNDRLGAFFKLFLKHSHQISRITVWGLNDAVSWKNDWPVKGRTDYPLLFDRAMKPKAVVETIISEAKK